MSSLHSLKIAPVASLRLMFIAGLLLVSSAAHAICFGPPTQVYVGDTSSDSSCTYNDIQSALNAEGSVCPAEVNITREHTYTNQALTISGKKLTLKGWGEGVTCNLLKNCTTVGCLPAESGAPLVTLSGGVGNSVLHIDGSSGVTLYDLTITGGILNPQQGGGGVYFGGTGSLSLQNTTVSNNQAGYGAGIAMSPSGSATLTLGPNTVIQHNDATVNGGGLLIEGSTYLQAISTNLYINDNTALAGDGGGLIVIAPATADIGSPGYFGLPAINGNSAAYGGGIAAEGSQNPPMDGLVRLFSTDPANPVTIGGNTASHTGGGIYLKPIVGDTRNLEIFCAYDFRIDGNSAAEGAAIYGDEQHSAAASDYTGAQLYLNLDATEDPSNQCNRAQLVATLSAVPCAAGVACNEIANNVAEDSNEQPTAGAAVLIQSGGTFVGDRFAVRGNQGGSAIHFLTDGDFSVMGIHNCLLANNTTSAELIDATPGGGSQEDVTIDSCTIAGNQIGAPYAMLVQLEDSDSFVLNNSLIAQPGRATVDYDGSLDKFTAEYDVSNDTSTLSGVGIGVAVGTPTFVDTANGDYHLQLTSVGVNYAPPGTTAHDLDGNTRVVNVPGVRDVFGAMDVGAYEIQSSCAVSDTIFCDGFDN